VGESDACPVRSGPLVPDRGSTPPTQATLAARKRCGVAQGKVTISNDGATIMKLLDIVHPAAKVLTDISLSQDSEVCTALPWLCA
jgi:TCP-1/cpn60 chaperonin family